MKGSACPSPFRAHRALHTISGRDAARRSTTGDGVAPLRPTRSLDRLFLSPQLQLSLHRLDDDADFRPMLQYEFDLNRVTDPQRYAQWQAPRRHVVQEAVTLPPPHIIESPHILTAPELTTGHRRIVVDTPVHQMSRHYLARGRAHDAEDPVRYADRHPGAPGSVAARAARVTRPADLRRPAPGDGRLPATP